MIVLRRILYIRIPQAKLTCIIHTCISRDGISGAYMCIYIFQACLNTHYTCMNLVLESESPRLFSIAVPTTVLQSIQGYKDTPVSIFIIIFTTCVTVSIIRTVNKFGLKRNVLICCNCKCMSIQCIFSYPNPLDLYGSSREFG